MEFSVLYKSMSLFSLKESNATSSGGISLIIPSPYAIKMAFISQAISLGGINFETEQKNFDTIKNAKISYRLSGDFCVNNCFVKTQKKRDISFNPTVGFREYVFSNEPIEIIFNVNNTEEAVFLKKYLYRINYFGKRGGFFQFLEYCDTPKSANVKIFDSKTFSTGGILQEYDDFESSLIFDNVNSYSTSKTKRKKTIYILPLSIGKSSKSFKCYHCY